MDETEGAAIVCVGTEDLTSFESSVSASEARCCPVKFACGPLRPRSTIRTLKSGLATGPSYDLNPFPTFRDWKLQERLSKLARRLSSFDWRSHHNHDARSWRGPRKATGGYAEYVTVDASAAAPIGQQVDPLGMAALGLASVTAFEGLRRLGDIESRRILVTGAAGGVGSAAVAIAKAQGAKVVGLLSTPKEEGYVRSLGASEIYTSAEAAAGSLQSESLDGVLDTVAGKSFGAYVNALRPGSALSLVGAVGGSEVTFDAYRLLEVTLTGYSSENLDGHSLRRAIKRISQWLIEGALRPPAVTSFPLSEAAAAHAALERREIRGRALLVPG